MQAFILRIMPSGRDRVPEALEANQLIIGWAYATGLLNPGLDWYQFREIVHETYYDSETSRHRAGRAAGHLWRFIREMKIGDLVVVPYGPNFYVAEIVGDAINLQDKAEEDSAYRRPVRWLNDKNPIPRSAARSALISRMKVYGTSASAHDLAEEIRDCVEVAASGQTPTFRGDLLASLAKQALKEVRTGRIESYGFEHLIREFLTSVGATDAKVIARNKDMGADLVATFRIAATFQFVVAVQAKHWQPGSPVSGNDVMQLIAGMDAENADLGMFITSGDISLEAIAVAEQHTEETGKRIELVDGEQFAKMLVEHGIGAMGRPAT